MFVYLQGCFRDGIARDERMAFGAEISNQKSLGSQAESLSKLATIYVSFCVLSCRILPLEDRKDQSPFLVGLVSTIPITSRRMRRPDRRPIWKLIPQSLLSCRRRSSGHALRMPRLAKGGAFPARLINLSLATPRLEGIEQRAGHRNLAHSTILWQKYSSLQLGSPMNFRRAAIPRRNS